MSSYATSGPKCRKYGMTALTCNKKFLQPTDKVYKQKHTTMSEYPFEELNFDTLPGTHHPEDVKAYKTDIPPHREGSHEHLDGSATISSCKCNN